MAMGDSITAGFAMKGIPPSDFFEYRDYVFSIGGADDALTMANWLNFYNPSLVGMAEDWTYPLTKGAYLDGGVSMAKAESLFTQVDYLVHQLHTTYRSVNFYDDWKLLTIFIGANNLCGVCTGNTDSTPAFFEATLRKVLQYVEAKIPRVFVNLVTIFNISGVWDAGMTKEYCVLLWDGITDHECYCLTTGVKSDRDQMDINGVKFNAISESLANEFNSQNNPNFTVVVQPGVSGFDVGYFGEGFLSDLDCFHPNEYANMAFAISIWNNMFTRVGKKATTLDPANLFIKCPTASSYLQ